MADFLNYPGAKDPLVASSRKNRGAEDPVVCEKVINSDPEYKITADQWPRGIYQNRKYDSCKPNEGSFQVHVAAPAPQSAKKLKDEADRENCIVNASEPENVCPESASKDTQLLLKKSRLAPSTLKKSVTHKINLCHITLRSLAYVFVHHRFVLSDASLWSDVDSDLDYMAYYNNIVDWFENAPGLRAQKEADELFVWWDQ
ncbi:hypothetical protein C8R45DRAFT_1091194 [Mycena sanguinolenta]|nr:hypothetical protein C8R45DRAFT_1091194 [Mycena sanguinolenta]